MPHNVWKFVITDAYHGAYEGDLPGRKVNDFFYLVTDIDSGGDGDYGEGIWIYDRYRMDETQLFFLAQEDVTQVSPDGKVTLRSTEHIHQVLELLPGERLQGYFAYYDGSDFTAVESTLTGENAGNFTLQKSKETAYLYTVESHSQNAAASVSWEKYSMVLSAGLPEMGLYTAPEATVQNFCDYQLLPTQTEYYLICQSEMQYDLRIRYDDTEKSDVPVAGIQAEAVSGKKNTWKITVTDVFDGQYWNNAYGRYDGIRLYIAADANQEETIDDARVAVYEQKRPWKSGNLVGRDGTVDTADILYLKRYLAMWRGYDEAALCTADLNRDGIVGPADVMILERHVAGWKQYQDLPVPQEPSANS